MSSVQRLSAGRVTADFFTASYRFSASVIVYKRKLVDVLSDQITDYLDMVDVYISRINAPGDIIATYNKGSLIKQEINFILLSTESEGISQERFYGTRATLPVFVSIPSFEITGQIQWGRQELDIKKIMGNEAQKFLPILDATATNAFHPVVTFEGPLILVNKAKLQVVCSNTRT